MEINYVEVVGLVLVLLSQVVVIAITIQSLRERVKALEAQVSQTLGSFTTISKIGTKLDLLYDFYVQRHKTK